MSQQKQYEHIQIFGYEGHVIVRIDGDADTEREFPTLDAALLAAIGVLCEARSHEGRTLHLSDEDLQRKADEAREDWLHEYDV